MSTEDRLYDLVAQWDQSRQEGKELPAEALCEDCPELIAALQERIASVKATDWLLDIDEDEQAFDSDSTVATNSAEAIVPTSVTLHDFTTRLVESCLLTPEQLEQVPSGDANTLVARLIRESLLTEYQARQVAEGNTSGLVLGNYVILDKIGAGGMGLVFKARHVRMDRLVALKVLPEKALASPQAMARFRREARAAARLNHVNVVTAHDADECDGTHFLVMEFVEGRDLSLLVKKNGPMPVGKAVECIRQAARGLEYAHKEGVIHRDIKPANLLLDSAGTIKILDMGLARLETTNGDGYDATHSELTADGSVLGTVDYMAPEQAIDTNSADARSDVYSLGCTLCYVLTGKAMYGGSTLMAKMLAHRDKEIPMLSTNRDDIPEKLTAVFRKMVGKSPDERYPTMTALLEELDALVSEYGDDWQQDYATANGSSVAVESEVDTRSKETSSAGLDDTIIKPPKIKPQYSPVSLDEKPKPVGHRGFLIVGGIVGLLMMGLIGYGLLGVILKIQTPDGVIQIETNVSDVEIFVDNEKVVYITDPKDKKRIKVEVPKGASMMRVSKAGFEADVTEFNLKTVNGPVKVTFVAKEKPPKSDKDRQDIAEWILSLGGQVMVEVNGKNSDWISSANELPDAEFEIVGVEFNYNRRVQDNDMKRLVGLPLESLYIGTTPISRQGCAILSGLTTLKRLAVNNVKFLDLFEDSKLVYLGMHHCGDQGMDSIARQTSLKHLYVGAPSSLTDKGMASLADLTKIEILQIEASGVTDLSLSHLSGMKDLKHLWLGHTRVTGAGFAELKGKLPALLELGLNDTRVTDAGIRHLAGVRVQSGLDLRGTGVTDEGLATLNTVLGGRSTLRVSRTQVTRRGIEALEMAVPGCVVIGNERAAADLVIRNRGGIQIAGVGEVFDSHVALPRKYFSVEAINLDGLAVIDDVSADRGTLHEIVTLVPHLKTLSVRGTKLTEKGIAALRKKLPNCEIIHD